MDDEAAFVDFYRILGVHPETSDRGLEAAYRDLAKRYHPDHPGTADVGKFGEVLAAYRALKSPQDRAIYNHQYTSVTGFEFRIETEGEEAHSDALSDAVAHEIILSALYKRRRESAREPGLGDYVLQQEVNCSDENFEFYVWYLKEKGFVALTEQGTLAITIEGVDHVISTSRTAAKEKLRIADWGKDSDDHFA